MGQARYRIKKPPEQVPTDLSRAKLTDRAANWPTPTRAAGSPSSDRGSRGRSRRFCHIVTMKSAAPGPSSSPWSMMTRPPRRAHLHDSRSMPAGDRVEHVDGTHRTRLPTTRPPTHQLPRSKKPRSFFGTRSSEAITAALRRSRLVATEPLVGRYRQPSSRIVEQPRRGRFRRLPVTAGHNLVIPNRRVAKPIDRTTGNYRVFCRTTANPALPRVRTRSLARTIPVG